MTERRAPRPEATVREGDPVAMRETEVELPRRALTASVICVSLDFHDSQTGFWSLTGFPVRTWLGTVMVPASDCSSSMGESPSVSISEASHASSNSCVPSAEDADADAGADADVDAGGVAWEGLGADGV